MVIRAALSAKENAVSIATNRLRGPKPFGIYVVNIHRKNAGAKGVVPLSGFSPYFIALSAAGEVSSLRRADYPGRPVLTSHSVPDHPGMPLRFLR